MRAAGEELQAAEVANNLWLSQAWRLTGRALEPAKPSLQATFQALGDCKGRQPSSRTWQAPVEPAARCASELPCEAGWPAKPHRFITPCVRWKEWEGRDSARPLHT